MNSSQPIRKEILDLLALLSYEERQLAYEKDVPHVDITKELVCMWFDDLYHPGQHFDSAFSRAELLALAEFSQYYEARLARLPESRGTVRTWLASPLWREIMHRAEEALNKIAEPGASPNGGLARPADNSGVRGGPPSAS